MVLITHFQQQLAFLDFDMVQVKYPFTYFVVQ